MDTIYFGWISLILLLFITTFGFFWFFTFIIALTTFLLGLLTILYLQHGNLENYLDSGLLENPLEDNGLRNGLQKVLSNVEEARSPSKSDARLTGSDVIDRAIREMLGYILRDHVHSWFHVISDDDCFDKQIKYSVQHCIIKVADRIKQVDWLSFLTTRLIDDIATHIKLYRQAKANIESNNKASTKNSPKSSPKKFLGESKSNKIHRRNKSDTDLKWHLGSKESQKSVANSRFYSADQPDDSTLSGIVQAFLSLDSKGQLIKNEKKLEEYYIFLADILLFYILPPHDFACPSLRAIMGPLIACGVVKPVLNALAEPDTINYIIVKLCCREGPPAGEYLLSGIRLCSDTQELSVIRELVQTEIHELRTGNTSDSSIKHQIKSLKYVQSIIDGRIKHLKGNIVIPPMSTSVLPLLPLEELLTKNVAISYYLDYLTQVNKQAYLFFYLNVEAWKISSEQHISDMQVNKMKGIKNSNLSSNDTMRDMASNLYEQYLGDSAVCQLDLPPHLCQELWWKIQNKQLAPTENWFNDLQEYVYGKFKTEDVFLSDFWRSSTYIKLLEELDLLTHPQTEEDNSSLDNISVSSLELAEHNTGSEEQVDQNIENKLNLPTFKTENYDSDTSANMENVIVTGYDLSVLPISAATVSINSSDHKKHSICDEINSQILTNKTTENDYLGSQLKHDSINRLNYMKHTRSHSDTSVKPDEKLSKSLSLQTTSTVPGIDFSTQFKPSQSNADYKNGVDRSKSLTNERSYDLKLANSKFYGNAEQAQDHDLSITIIETGVVCEGGRSWGVYALRVIRQKTVSSNEPATSNPYLKECWHVYRRYSHFLDLQKAVKKKFSDLSKLQFPAKKAFHNMDRDVLEHRMSVLNSYMNSLCLASKKPTHKVLKDMLADFCEPQAYDKKVAGGAVIKTIDTLVNPLRSGMRTIKNMPDHFLNSVDELVGGLSRALLGKEPFTADEIEAPDNPALRSALLLIDEAFDLKGRSQWLRRGVLGRVLQGTWLGGVANRRLLHLASSLAGHNMVLKAISFIQQSLWPDGERVTSGPSRDQDQMYRTKMAAKTALLASMSDDLKHLLGSETTRSGVMNIFYLLQQKDLNLRLLVVVLENILTTMYPGIEKALANAKSDR